MIAILREIKFGKVSHYINGGVYIRFSTVPSLLNIGRRQKLARVQTGNSVDFQNILNRLSNECL